MQRGIARVRSLCGPLAGLLYRQGRGGKGRAAGKPAVTGNRDVGRVERVAGAAEIPELSDPGRNERIDGFTGARPIILGGVEGAIGKSALERRRSLTRMRSSSLY